MANLSQTLTLFFCSTCLRTVLSNTTRWSYPNNLILFHLIVEVGARVLPNSLFWMVPYDTQHQPESIKPLPNHSNPWHEVQCATRYFSSCMCTGQQKVPRQHSDLAGISNYLLCWQSHFTKIQHMQNGFIKILGNIYLLPIPKHTLQVPPLSPSFVLFSSLLLTITFFCWNKVQLSLARQFHLWSYNHGTNQSDTNESFAISSIAENRSLCLQFLSN